MNQKNKPVICYTDGAARGNPGPAGIGIIITAHDGTTIAEIHDFIGDKLTNNVAEYSAVIRLLKELVKRGLNHAVVNIDSELIVNQINGIYRTKDVTLRELLDTVKQLQQNLVDVEYKYVPREQNKIADKLANTALNLHNARK
jgi:ribonuclease HI